MVNLSQLPPIEEAIAALPERVRGNAGCMARLQCNDPELAMARFKDHFWKADPDGRGMVHSLPDDELLSFMLAVYVNQGGQAPEKALSFWEKIFTQ
jgi:hypothetical protein